MHLGREKREKKFVDEKGENIKNNMGGRGHGRIRTGKVGRGKK